MIKPWILFNESKETFTVEMAQEIAYYILDEEGNRESGDPLLDALFGLPECNFDDFDTYETSYEEMKNNVKIIFDTSKKYPDTVDKLVMIYNEIRNRVDIFPLVCEIEDVYLDLIESRNASLYVLMYDKDKEYIIKINFTSSSHGSFDDFIKTSTNIRNSTRRLESVKYNTNLYDVRYYCYDDMHTMDFYIQLNV